MLTGDAEAVAEQLGAAEDAPLGEVVPALASWFGRQQLRGWTHVPVWEPVPITSAPRSGGPLLVLAPG